MAMPLSDETVTLLSYPTVYAAERSISPVNGECQGGKIWLACYGSYEGCDDVCYLQHVSRLSLSMVFEHDYQGMLTTRACAINNHNNLSAP